MDSRAAARPLTHSLSATQQQAPTARHPTPSADRTPESVFSLGNRAVRASKGFGGVLPTRWEYAVPLGPFVAGIHRVPPPLPARREILQRDDSAVWTTNL